MTKQNKINCVISIIVAIALIVLVILDHCIIGTIAAIIGFVLVVGGTCIVLSQDKKLRSLENPTTEQ